MIESLWGEEYNIDDEKKTKKIINKIKEPKEITSRTLQSRKLSVEDRLKLVESEVHRILGSYESNTQVITSQEALHNLITKAIELGEIAIDTETNNSLDPITCKLMGLCLYVEGEKNTYIPVNHIDRNTKELLDNQIREDFIAEELKRLSGTKIIMHNGKFDYQVLKCTCGVKLNVYWDTMIGARLLNENEKAGLKEQYISKIDPTIEKYSIENLFDKLEYAIVDPDLFALYAATDAFMTYQLYKYQEKLFNLTENSKLNSLFHNIEMPIMEVAAEMELTGISIDQEYSKLLSAKYHKKLDLIDQKIAAELEKYVDKVKAWKTDLGAKIKQNYTQAEAEEWESKLNLIEWPINTASPAQLSIFLYDILNVKPVSKKSPRGTGEDILEQINLPICKLILERRGLLKLINTYIDKLPACINPKTGRLHAQFNQIGAGTGRFSSTEPNLQNIPSHNKDIRMIFIPQEGNAMVGSDFSQQEVRLLAEYAQDEHMIESYHQNKDIYASVASMVYKNNYEDNLEHYPDGRENPEGKKRRSFCKSIVLGLMYQRGAASIAEQIDQPIEKAQEIIDDFYRSFPKVRTYVQDTQKFVHEHGYVEDFWGRRRRLPDINLPKYEIKDKNSADTIDFNPLLGCAGIINLSNNPLLEYYKHQLAQAKSGREVRDIIAEALKDNISIKDNSGFIAQAERQSVNARIQGGAATLTKIAMIKVYKDDELNRLGFKLLLAVHDELIGECPKENAEAVAERLTYLMKHAGEPTIKINFSCDPTIEHCWYFSDFEATVKKEYKSKIKEGLSKEEAFTEICTERTESTIPQLHEILDPVMEAI